MTFSRPVLPSLAVAVADEAERHCRKLSLSFILGGGHHAVQEETTEHAFAYQPPPPSQPLPDRKLPSMFRPFKPETVYDYSYGRLPVRPLLHHRFAPLARVMPLASPPPPPRTEDCVYSPLSSTASSPSQFVVSRRPPRLSNVPKKKTYEQMTKAEKRKSRACRVDGCASYIINRGLCFRHGGGKRCAEPGCDSSAKNQGLCWKHGGSTNCIIDECTRRGKARGLCWAHGGGTQCSTQSCTTIAVSNGKCWAHGGGKRCAFESCTRAAYERTYNYCFKHHELLRDGHHSVDL